MDYIAVALLVVGALRSSRVLAAGWGFASAMFYMAVFTAAEDRNTPVPLLAGMAAMLAVAVVGLGLSLAARRDAVPAPARPVGPGDMSATDTGR